MLNTELDSTGRRVNPTSRVSRLLLALVPLVLLGVGGPAAAADFGSVAFSSSVSKLVGGVTKAELAQSVAEISGETQAIVGGTATYLPTRSAKDPRVALAEQYFFEHLNGYGLSSVAYQSYPGTGVVPPGRNVIGQITGTTKANEIVIISAHLDDRPWSGGLAYGSDDDASGCAAVLYVAKSFAGKQFDRTIRFVFFDAEEDAPWSGSGKYFGSGYYAAAARAAGENIVAEVDADALAWNLSSNGVVYMVTHKRQSSAAAADLAIVAVWQQAIKAYSIAGITPLAQQSGDNLSDHGSFWANGYPAVMLIEDDVSQVNPNWHTLNDRVTTPGWRWDFYVSNVKSLVAAAAHLAGIR